MSGTGLEQTACSPANGQQPAAAAPTSRAIGQAEPGSPAEKARATLAAQLALAGGHALIQLDDGSFIVARWGHSRHCADLADVASFARRIGVKC